MTYDFKEFDGKYGRRSGGEYITIRPNYRYLSTGFCDKVKMDRWKNVPVNIFTDKENEAIAIEVLPAAHTGKSTTTVSFGYFGTSIDRAMPYGRYEFIEEKQGRYIFKLKKKQCSI